MRVYVKIYASLRQYVSNSEEMTRKEGWEVAQGASVDDVLRELHFPESLKILALINGAHCLDRGAPLKDGDSLLLYPLMSGG
jgi:molybdopterin converting factor small subunit